MSKNADIIDSLLKELFPFAVVKKEHYVQYKNQKLYVDFYMPAYLIAIEVHGKQHDEFVEYFHGSAHGWRMHKKRDRLKEEWADSNSITYVVMNTVISVAVALPAAYAFSRYKFLGDKHLFFWLLTNRMAPPAVFALPFFQLYSSVGLFDTHIAVALAHTLFNVPLTVWILEGFMRGVPKEIDETAYIDGFSFMKFFTKIFTPLIASGIGVAAFFCFMFSWVELLLSRTLTSVNAKSIAVTMTKTVSASGVDWGVLAAAGVLTLVPGALVIYFVRNHIAKGLSLGRV